MANQNFMVFSEDEEGRDRLFRGPRMLEAWPPPERVIAIAHSLDQEGLISVVTPEEFQRMVDSAQSRGALEAFRDTYVAWECVLTKRSEIEDDEITDMPSVARGANYRRLKEVAWKASTSPSEPSSTASE